MSIKLGNTTIAGATIQLGQPLNIGQIIPSALPLQDAGLHLLDGSLILGGGIYSAFVDYIAGLISTYPDLFETEANWQSAVTTYGVCGKFVYTQGTPTYYAFYITANGAGSTNYYVTSKTPSIGDKVYKLVDGNITEEATLTSGNSGWNIYQGAIRYGYYGTTWYSTGDITGTPSTVRLPKISGLLEGTTEVTALGDLIEQYVKLPNISGWWHSDGTDGGFNAGGAVFVSSTFSDNGRGHSGNTTTPLFSLDASRSSSVYSGDGTNTKIQQQALKVLYYIVIATSVKTEIEVDIDEIATDLNGKADTDLSNTTPSQTFIGSSVDWAMPDYADAMDISSTVTTSSTQNRNYAYPCLLIIKCRDSNVSGGYISFICEGFGFGQGNYSYNSVPTLIYIPANTNFQLFYNQAPNNSGEAYIVPLKGVTH